MNWSKVITKVGGVAMIIFSEVKDDLTDNKLTIDEVINTAKTVVDKLGYGGKAIVNFTKKD